MADYHSPTVVCPDIPANAITPLEYALLTGMFEHEIEDDAIYFYSSEGPSDTVWLDVDELKAMLAAEGEAADHIVTTIRAWLAEAGPDETELELDMSDLREAAIFQRIVRRCDQLDHVTITSAWVCSKMRSDGFGGGVTVVTADHILSDSTADMECRLLDQATYGDLGCAPGHGRHPVLMLGEDEVRQFVVDIRQSHVDAGISALDVSHYHIRQAALDLIPTFDFDEQRRAIAFDVAMAAIDIAGRAAA